MNDKSPSGEVIDLAGELRSRTVSQLVQKTKVCPYTGQPLDPANVVVLVNLKGVPVHVVSQEGWAQVTPTARQWFATRGMQPDESTVQS